MRLILILFFLASTSILWCQIGPKFSYDVYAQSRLLHQPNALSNGQEFGAGMRINYPLTNTFSINFGGLLNFAQYSKDNDEGMETFFVDFFKGTRIDYFNFQTSQQLSLETPIGINWSIGKVLNSKISLIGNLTPSFNLFSASEGYRFEELVRVQTSVAEIFQQNNASPLNKHNLFGDVLIGSGIHLDFPVKSSRSLFIESGYEYSIKGKSSGIFIRTGLKF